MTWTKERHEAVKVRCETPNVHGWGDLPDALAEIERLTAKASVCEWQHRPCVDCGAMGTFVGQGLYECWKCTSTELKAERDTARAELHACGMELQTCRATLEEERRDGDAQRAEIERITDERIEIDRTLDEAGVMVASGETTCSRVARMIADANMESERTLTAEKEAERLTAELAGQSKATLTWRDTAERHLARAKVAERDLAALRTAYEATLADLMKEQSCHRGTRERLEKASALSAVVKERAERHDADVIGQALTVASGAQAVASMGVGTSLEARAADAKEAYFASLNEHRDRQPDRAWIDVVRAADASRPGLTEEQARDEVRTVLGRFFAMTPTTIAAVNALVPILRASRGETGPAPIDYPGVRDALRALAHAMCATQARDPEQKAQLQRAAEAHDALRYALGDKDPSGETGPAPTWGEQAIAEHRRAAAPIVKAPPAALHAPREAPAPGDVSAPRAILERLVDATAWHEGAREAREQAKRILQQAPLAAEPARTDPEAARQLAARGGQ